MKKDNAEDVNQKFTHLTNAAIQKKHPDFEKDKENTIWSVEKYEVRFQSFIKNIFYIISLTFINDSFVDLLTNQNYIQTNYDVTPS